ncbi:MAG: VOC family protein [Pseudomonadota bacterium]|nr:VOC family protein [Pseudomonadota bacterium]
MITGIQDFHYNVKDIKKSVQFYTDALCMKVSFQEKGWTSMECGSAHIGLHSVEHDIPKFARDSHGAYAGGTLTLKSDNISEDRKRLEKHGAKILGEDDAAWGHMLVFEDVDGNVLKLMKPKY